jgi:NAD(P)-dependent dehydrogenase (short-subunit alcohol dehydrogenase family)
MHKRILVTGGAQRLGALLCRAFAQAGWEVWCHYQRSGSLAHALVAELRESGYVAYAVQADLALEAQRLRMMEQVVSQGGALHCLVNNASLFEEDAADALDMEAVRRQWEVNLLAPLSLSALMAKRLPPDALPGDCSIIHVLDQKVFNLNPDYFSYTVSKLALERSVALQAQALAPTLRVCGVAPGLMFVSGEQTQDNFARSSRVNLMQTALDPQRVAQSVLFLAENPCITGVTLTVDNGQHLVPLARDVMFALQDNGNPAT